MLLKAFKKTKKEDDVDGIETIPRLPFMLLLTAGDSCAQLELSDCQAVGNPISCPTTHKAARGPGLGYVASQPCAGSNNVSQ